MNVLPGGIWLACGSAALKCALFFWVHKYVKDALIVFGCVCLCVCVGIQVFCVCMFVFLFTKKHIISSEMRAEFVNARAESN